MLNFHVQLSQKRVIDHDSRNQLSGALDGFDFEETTPVIGREYININIVKDLLEGKASDQRLRDLAITSKLLSEYQETGIEYDKSRSEALSSFENRTISIIICKSS